MRLRLPIGLVVLGESCSTLRGAPSPRRCTDRPISSSVSSARQGTETVNIRARVRSGIQAVDLGGPATPAELAHDPESAGGERLLVDRLHVDYPDWARALPGCPQDI